LEGWEKDVVNRILQGDAHSYEEIITAYKNAVFSLCYRMVYQKQEAEDLSQEVFLKAYRSLGKYDRGMKFSTWILTIARNTCIDYLRRRKEKNLPLEEGLKAGEAPISAEEAYLYKEQQREIEAAIERLPGEYRLLIILYHQQSRSYKEIAAILDLPMTIVKNRLYRGRKMLKEELDPIRKEGSPWTAEAVKNI
jgi:RNA polymerase sigma-70 factor, ECF subfamily